MNTNRRITASELNPSQNVQLKPPFPWRSVTVRGHEHLVNIVSDAPDPPCDHTVVASMVPKDGWFHRWIMGAEARERLSGT